MFDEKEDAGAKDFLGCGSDKPRKTKEEGTGGGDERSEFSGLDKGQQRSIRKPASVLLRHNS